MGQSRVAPPLLTTLLSCSFISAFFTNETIVSSRTEREFWTQCVNFFHTRVATDEAVDAGLGVGVLVNSIISFLVIPYFSINILGQLQEKDKRY